MHYSQTTGGHAVPPAAGGVLHHSETTVLKPSETGRAYAAASPLSGHGVAPFGNNSAEAVGDGPEAVG
ncbi:MAG: hypothetical protein LBD24_02460 [Spirochaetaceae bacterium]|nr:hypothetical protein [Spirochaetaceae bacterium]